MIRLNNLLLIAFAGVSITANADTPQPPDPSNPDGVCPVPEISSGVYTVSYDQGRISVATHKIIIK